ncbi:MAG: PLAT/LH2 domain-containing protein [Myxococcota bacterium]
MTAITSLIVKLVTSSDADSGTNDFVYFGIGTREWYLDTDRDDFEPGQTRAYTLAISPGLDTSHITAIQLRKTGTDGWKPQTIEVWVNNPAMSGTPLYRGTINMFLDGGEGAGLLYGLRWQAPDFGTPVSLGSGRTDAAVTSLEVRLTTASDADSGTNDSVYFNVGTREWLLDRADHDDFQTGATDTYTLRALGSLRLSHIRQIALRKEGTDGWKVQHIRVTANGSVLLDEAVGTWLDGGPGEELKHGKWWASRNYPSRAAAGTAVTQLRVTVETDDVANAGTGDYLYFSNGINEWTLGDPSSNFARNTSNTFTLRNLSGVRRSDFRQIMIRKEGTDGWALKSVQVEVNSTTIYRGGTRMFLDGDGADSANTHGLYWSAPDFSGSSASCSVWIPTASSTSYTDWVAAPTQGRLELLINGRNSNGSSPDIDATQPLDEMERSVKALGSGDFCYLSAWFFEPATGLQTGAYSGETTWGSLLGKKAGEGVEVRILINDFDPFSGLDAWLRRSSLTPLEALVRGLSATARARFKYIVSRHPASYGGLRAAAIRALHGGGSGPIFIGSHHQKFMVTRQGNATTAYCGGLDIESRKVPSAWSYSGMIGWHDLTMKMEGPITRDVERQFVERWNREQGGARNSLLPDWGSFGTLSQPSRLHADDNTAAKRAHSVQLTRTISSGATIGAYTVNRRDVRQSYTKIINCARSFLYLENQYFRDLSLADELVARAGAASSLRAIFVVLANAAADDGTNPLTSHGDGLQHEFFRRVTTAFGSRAAVYTMFNRSVHSKMIMADDQTMSVGSANANVRSFELDSELNVTVDQREWVRAAREKMWSHNLGVTAATVRGWAVNDFITRWNAVATANGRLTSAANLPRMAGEGIVVFNWSGNAGSRNQLIPDYLVNLDIAPAPQGIYGPTEGGPGFPVGGGDGTAIA